MKKFVSLFMAVILAVTLIPFGIGKQADAAADAPFYFSPDITSLKKTATYRIDNSNTTDTLLSRDNAYIVYQSTLSFEGAYANVLPTGMSARIEHLNQNSNGTWTVDAAQFTTGVVQADSGTSPRFKANSLSLFSGMNRVTLIGMNGSNQRSDSFYVLYDQVPYVENLFVRSGTAEISLNEGSQAVVPNQTVLPRGTVRNTNEVTLSLNGASPSQISVPDSGVLSLPALTLQPGLNTITLTLKNGSDTITITRQLFYYSAVNSFTSIIMQYGADTFELANNTPSVTTSKSPADQAEGLTVTMLVPDISAATPFAGNADYSINSTVTGTVNAADIISDTLIPSSDSTIPNYRLIKFKLPSFPLQKDSLGNLLADQKVQLSLAYPDTTTSSVTARFQFLPGNTVIKDMQLLTNYNPIVDPDVTSADRSPLKGAEVTDSTFYILLTADKALVAGTNDKLYGKYLPYSTTPLTLTRESGATGLAADGTQAVYKVTGFLNGQQTVQFQLGSPTKAFDAAYAASISYIQKSYIYIANLTDGQQVSFDSKATTTVNVKGQYLGFDDLQDEQYVINGMSYAYTTTEMNSTTHAFELNLTVDSSILGKLVAGENRLTFKGTNVTPGGVRQDVVKEIRIYLVDKNVPTVAKFQPALGEGRVGFVLAGLDNYDADMSKIMSVSPVFKPVDGHYETNETLYDLVIRGSGAKFAELKLGSESISGPIEIPESVTSSTTAIQGQLSYNSTHPYYYDLIGDSGDFILRIKDIPFPDEGSRVYNLVLTNSSGASTSQLLEITKVVSPYRILSPVATVGDQITVNKNFVHFDIEAKGATDVLINGVSATKREDLANRFVYDFVGLKPDKATSIKIQIQQAGNSFTETVSVFYSSTVQVDSQYMQKMGSKFSIFNKQLELTFPKNTVLKAATPNANQVTKLYTDTNLLFGIADPNTGIVERRNDYGDIIGVDPDQRTDANLPVGSRVVLIDYLLSEFYTNPTAFLNFSNVSPTYWISGGVGEERNVGETGYKPATNGLTPYSIEGVFGVSFPSERKVVPTNRGELTLKFDESVVDEAGTTITVFRFTDKKQWENIGGAADMKKHTITVPFDDFGYYKVVKMKKSFSDITLHPWARNILNALYSKGIMNPLKISEFGVYDTTTRGEFATLLVKGLNIPLNYDANNTFPEITLGLETTTWDYAHIETAARAGIVTGNTDGSFGADDPITRQDAAVMIARALELKMATNDSKLEAALAKAFVDSSSISYYARPAVDAVNKAKIMTGSSTTLPGQKKPVYNFNPQSPMTRAEAGKVAVELLKLSTDIFSSNLS